MTYQKAKNLCLASVVPRVGLRWYWRDKPHTVFKVYAINVSVLSKIVKTQPSTMPFLVYWPGEGMPIAEWHVYLKEGAICL